VQLHSTNHSTKLLPATTQVENGLIITNQHTCSYLKQNHLQNADFSTNY